MGDEDEEARKFLERFAEEFPAPLEGDSPLPVSPLSRRVSLEELHGESLEVGLKLLAARYCSSEGKKNTFCTIASRHHCNICTWDKKTSFFASRASRQPLQVNFVVTLLTKGRVSLALWFFLNPPLLSNISA